MAKYNYDFKKMIVNRYLSGEGGRLVLAKEYNVDRTLIRTWIRTYDKYGYEGLKKRKNRQYSFDFKMNIVKLYLSGEYSLTDLGDNFGIMNSGTISGWIKLYELHGGSAFITKKKGRKPVMKKNRQKLTDQEKNEYISSLEEQLKESKLENKLLKQLRGLRLAKEKQNKKQE